MKNLRVENEYVTKKEFRAVTDKIMEKLNMLNVLKSSVLNIERQMGIYYDMFKDNKLNNGKLAKRLNIVEKHIGIKPEEDLLVSGY